jgi:glutathione S-transferase
MKLYYIPTTRAIRPRWLLEEMEMPYELVQVTMAMTKEPEYKQLHPHGKVPVLIDGKITIFESAAICSYLADKYLDKGFAPALDSPDRAYYYQWLFYATATLEPPVEHFLFNVLPHLPEKVLPGFIRSEISKQESYQWFQRVSEPVRAAIHDQDFLVGNSLTAADVVVGGVLFWAKKLGMLQPDDSLTAYIDNLIQRPAFTRADENYSAQVPTDSD